jgi:hypothetical protein
VLSNCSAPRLERQCVNTWMQPTVQGAGFWSQHFGGRANSFSWSYGCCWSFTHLSATPIHRANEGQRSHEDSASSWMGPSPVTWLGSGSWIPATGKGINLVGFKRFDYSPLLNASRPTLHSASLRCSYTFRGTSPFFRKSQGDGNILQKNSELQVGQGCWWSWMTDFI